MSQASGPHFVPRPPPGRSTVKTGRRQTGGCTRPRTRPGSWRPPPPASKVPRPRLLAEDTNLDTDCSENEGCARIDEEPETAAEPPSTAAYTLVVAQWADVPKAIENSADQFVSCRQVAGGVQLLFRPQSAGRREPSPEPAQPAHGEGLVQKDCKLADVQGTLEELEQEVPEVDEEWDENQWIDINPRQLRDGGAEPHPPPEARRRPPAPRRGARGEFSRSAWPEGPRRLPLDRPRSAQYTREMQYKSPYSQCRPSSASRASRPRPCSARPASRPSSARPQSARTRPQSARPSSGRPSSGRPASAKVPAPPRHGIRPQSAPTCMEMRHHSCASIKPRPASAMPAARCPDDKGVSILFQQQQFLEKQMAEQGLHAQAPGFATLMQDWLASYQKSRVRARMACRPLWGEGSNMQLSFPKPPPPPRPLSAPTRRNLDEELAQLEEALEGPLLVREVDSKADSVADGKSRQSRRSTEPELVDIMQSENRPYGFLPSPEKRMTLLLPVNDGTAAATALAQALHAPASPRSDHGASTIMREPSMFREGSIQQSAGEGASTEGGDALSIAGDDILTGPAARMMPRKDIIHKVFSRLANDGEVHKDSLAKALELMGLRHASEDWMDSILEAITRYTTLNFEEYLRFVRLYLDKQASEFERAFYQCDRDGSGTIEAAELVSLLSNIGITPMDHVLTELIEEHDLDSSGDMDLGEFCAVLAAINEREGFTKAEYERFKHAFNLFDNDDTSTLETEELLAILGYLGYEMSTDVVNNMLDEVDVDGSGTLSFSEFLIFMRKVREQEVQRLEDELDRLSLLPAGDKEDMLTGLLRIMGYVPDKEAVRDAAADSNINLAKPTMRRASLVQLCMPNSSKQPGHGVVATPTYKSTVTLSEAYRFLEVYRFREGFTRAEAAELQDHYNKFAETPGPADVMRISSYDAGRALTWLGYRASHEEHQLTFSQVDVGGSGSISLAEFLKLVRIYRQKELEEIRASFLRIGLAKGAEPSEEGTRAARHSLAFLGMGRMHSEKASRARDMEDARYGVLRMAVSKRSQMRAIAQMHHGFSGNEVEALQCRFSQYDADGSGTISAAELRLLCQEMLPKMATDPKSRPELIRLIKEVDSSGDGNLNFEEFLKLMRDLEDSQRQNRFNKETHVLDQLPFTKHEIRDFRQLFIENMTDADDEDLISFKAVQSLLTTLVPMGDRRVVQLAEIWHRNVDMPRRGQDLETWTLDFPDFLLLMHALLEADFCGIKAKSAAAVSEMEKQRKKNKEPGRSKSMRTSFTLPAGSNTLMLDDDFLLTSRTLKAREASGFEY